MDDLKLLILEDESIIMMDLAMTAEEFDATPLTANSVRAAMKVIDENTLDGAILDVSLGRGETCQPVAERLAALGIPFVLHTGDLHRQGEWVSAIDAPVILKPAPTEKVIAEALEAMDLRVPAK